MTMNWFGSVPLDPPLIRFGVLRQAPNAAVVLERKTHARFDRRS
jgi:flavin reductase (DIM6/NTAB) family NADH-FMN oxidoreductase RutF